MHPHVSTFIDSIILGIVYEIIMINPIFSITGIFYLYTPSVTILDSVSDYLVIMACVIKGNTIKLVSFDNVSFYKIIFTSNS